MAVRLRAPGEAVRQAAEELARRLRARFGASDVDVAVVLDQVDWATRCAVIDLATDIGLDTDIRLSPTLFDRTTFDRWLRQERALVLDIVREGVPL